VIATAAEKTTVPVGPVGPVAPPEPPEPLACKLILYVPAPEFVLSTKPRTCPDEGKVPPPSVQSPFTLALI
jgi:hypothetical protein